MHVGQPDRGRRRTTSAACWARVSSSPTTAPPPRVREGLERVKRLDAATGKAGTTMGFGQWDHGALKGDYLVLRAWRGGRTVEVD